MIWDSILNFLRFWKEGDSKAYRGFVPDPCHLSARGVVITRVSLSRNWWWKLLSHNEL